MVTGRHSQGAYTNIRCYSAGVGLHTGVAVRLKYIYSRCCSTEIYTGDAILHEYTIMCDAVLLEYIRAMLGLATPGTGDPWKWRPQTSEIHVGNRRTLTQYDAYNWDPACT